MDAPTAKAEWVLTTYGVDDRPAAALHRIAEQAGIRYGYEELPEEPDLCGELLYKGEKKAILINTFNSKPVRQTFTFAHELGHYFLQHQPSYRADGTSGFACTQTDIKKGLQQEAEANRFAVALLMPERMFRPLMAGSVLDFTLIDSLAREFMVSKHACSFRILNFIRDPYAVITSSGYSVTTLKISRSGRGYLPELKTIPQDTAAHAAIAHKRSQESFTPCPPERWLARPIPEQYVYECTRGHFTSGVAMTILRW